MVANEILTHTFIHPWNEISIANWLKYPSTERPDVLSVDMLKKNFDPNTGILTTTRLTILKSSLPSWLETIFGHCHCLFLEEATVDPKKKIMILKARNITMKSIIHMQEICTYTPHPASTKWTLFKQEACVKAFAFGIANKIEEFAVQSFRQNATKGRELMEHAVSRIKQEAEDTLNAVEEFGMKMKQDAEQIGSRLKKEAGDVVEKQKSLALLD